MLENSLKIAHISFTYKKVNKSDSLQPCGCNGRLFHRKALYDYIVFFLFIF